MGWICEIALTGDSSQAAALARWGAEEAPARLSSCKGLLALDAYVPAADEPRDPYNAHKTPPPLMLFAAFDSEDSLRRAMGGGRVVADLLAAAPEGTEPAASAFRREFYPVGEGSGAPLRAPVSYVVRYTRPAADEALFVRDYVDGHPPTQARFPNIRSIMCYFPLRDVAVPGWPARDYLIGNEVAFDSVEDFNAAMASPAREELREHFRAFPAFSGTVSHFLMRRERVHERTEAAGGVRR